MVKTSSGHSRFIRDTFWIHLQYLVDLFSFTERRIGTADAVAPPPDETLNNRKSNKDCSASESSFFLLTDEAIDVELGNRIRIRTHRTPCDRGGWETVHPQRHLKANLQHWDYNNLASRKSAASGGLEWLYFFYHLLHLWWSSKCNQPADWCTANNFDAVCLNDIRSDERL